MASATTTLAPSNSSATLFRAWGSWISGRFSANSWTQTADTGQVNWTTVSAPVAINTSAGFEVWETTDGVGTQFFVKMEYGSGGAVNTPAIWVTLGTGSNGSGTLTGQVGTRQQVAAGSNTTSTSTSVSGGGTSWITFQLFNTTSNCLGFTLERTKTATGSDSNVGMVFMGWASTTQFHQVVPESGKIWTLDTALPYIIGRNSGLSDGTNIGAYPILPVIQFPYPACLGCIMFNSTDIPSGTAVLLSRYGTYHNYYSCNTSTALTTFNIGIRYE